MFYQIWEDEQSLHIQPSHPKLFCILGAKFCCIHFFQINFARNPATSVDRWGFQLDLNVDCSLLERLWHRAIEIEQITEDHVVLFEQTLA